MRMLSILTLAALVTTVVSAPMVMADEYSQVTQTYSATPAQAYSTTTTTTVDQTPSTVIIREQPAVIAVPQVQTSKTVIKEKRKRHHLLKLPFISVF